MPSFLTFYGTVNFDGPVKSRETDDKVMLPVKMGSALDFGQKTMWVMKILDSCAMISRLKPLLPLKNKIAPWRGRY
jgi:hypothetical protein